jgi:hypothetical protein
MAFEPYIPRTIIIVIFYRKFLICVQMLSVSHITSKIHAIALFVFINLQTIRMYNMPFVGAFML